MNMEAHTSEEEARQILGQLRGFFFLCEGHGGGTVADVLSRIALFLRVLPLQLTHVSTCACMCVCMPACEHMLPACVLMHFLSNA